MTHRSNPSLLRFACVPALLALLTISWSATSASAQLRVVTTTTDLGDLARTIGGSRVTVETICQGKQDPHHVQARPSYMVTLSRADLLVAAGLDLEAAWLPALVRGARNPEIAPGSPGYFDASSAITPIDVPASVDRSQGDVHPNGNPHYWLDPERVKHVVRALAARLSQLDPEGSAQYQKKSTELMQRLDAAIARWQKALAPYRGMKLVSYHKTFDYFLQRFGLLAIGYVEERPGIPPSPAHLSRLITAMRSQGVTLLLHEALFERGASDIVASRSDARVLVLPTSVGGDAAATSYERLIDSIVRAVAAELQKQAGGKS